MNVDSQNLDHVSSETIYPDQKSEHEESQTKSPPPHPSHQKSTSSIVRLHELITTDQLTTSHETDDQPTQTDDGIRDEFDIGCNDGSTNLGSGYMVTKSHDDDDDEDLFDTIIDQFSSINHHMDDEEEDDDAKFDWTQYLPDQILVFDETKSTHIIDIAVNRIRPPRSSDYVPVSANTIFLCSRYAQHCTSSDTLHMFLFTAIHEIQSSIESNPTNLSSHAYWISNTMQLLVYLKRDTGLLVSTVDAQCMLSELITDTCHATLNLVHNIISRVLNVSIIEYDKQRVLDTVRYETVFFGYGKRKSVLKLHHKYGVPRYNDHGTRSPSPPNTHTVSSSHRIRHNEQSKPSPQTIVCILESVLNCLVSCHVHPQIVRQIMHHSVRFINAKLFNMILSTRDLCCRARAMQIHMNLEVVLDWLRDISSTCPHLSTKPDTSNTTTISNFLDMHLRPVLHLLRFLQVSTSVGDLGGFLELCSSLDSIRIPHMHKALHQYRYEVNEPSVPDDVEMYLQTMMDEMVIQQPIVDGTDHVGSLSPYLEETVCNAVSVPVFGHDDVLWSSVPSIPMEVVEMMDATIQ